MASLDTCPACGATGYRLDRAHIDLQCLHCHANREIRRRAADHVAREIRRAVEEGVEGRLAISVPVSRYSEPMRFEVTPISSRERRFVDIPPTAGADFAEPEPAPKPTIGRRVRVVALALAMSVMGGVVEASETPIRDGVKAYAAQKAAEHPTSPEAVKKADRRSRAVMVAGIAVAALGVMVQDKYFITKGESLAAGYTLMVAGTALLVGANSGR